MAEPRPVYLVTVWKGGVLAHQPSGRPSGVVMQLAGATGNEQKWIPEFGEEPDSVALKNVANGEYLFGNGEDYKEAGTGEKTWWRMSTDDVTTPGAFRLCHMGTKVKNLCIVHQGTHNESSRLIQHIWYPVGSVATAPSYTARTFY
jgi:hypothetical protein